MTMIYIYVIYIYNIYIYIYIYNITKESWFLQVDMETLQHEYNDIQVSLTEAVTAAIAAIFNISS